MEKAVLLDVPPSLPLSGTVPATAFVMQVPACQFSLTASFTIALATIVDLCKSPAFCSFPFFGPVALLDVLGEIS